MRPTCGSVEIDDFLVMISIVNRNRLCREGESTGYATVLASDQNLHVVEGGPIDTGRSILGREARYVHLRHGAQVALESGLVAATVRSLSS